MVLWGSSLTSIEAQIGALKPHLAQQGYVNVLLLKWVGICIRVNIHEP